ncbi:hypothetical protein BDA99DRAFT_525567 [Phascolomyces articulosus]|uniref:Uncharacterized protein n=1 Tax=Phascolomyces articulosus TaxID=60185 RepID=A0AAD5JP66_9FUNG|nr:hypothetical protein BDA99DRAFT_525567 [Phascolomyces articulosus]
MSLRVPPTKIRSLRREAHKLINNSKAITIRRLSSFIGKAQAMTLAVLPARLYTRELISCRNHFRSKGLDWNDPIPLSP